LISDQPATPFAEAFRLLAINVRALFGDAPNQAVVVMSAFPEEGRTMVAANLALALGEHGRVLLVPESGGRRGSFPMRAMLSSGTTDTDDTATHSKWSTKATGYPNVSILDWAGSLHASTALLDEVKRANEAGTFVVVDSPPAVNASEAYLLAQQVGNVLYVVPDRVQDMNVHSQIREHLQRLRVRIAGVIINEV
jgi:Mrp family chromosome partitioning ATPase